MSLPVVIVTSGGIPVVNVTSLGPRTGLPVIQALNGYGIPVRLVSFGPPMVPQAMPVVFEVPPV